MNSNTRKSIELLDMSTIQYFRNFQPNRLQLSNNTDKIRRPYIDVGDFLPQEDKFEIEIVRINLSSTTGDVYSIRLYYNEENNFEIKIQDEYETKFSEYKSEYTNIPTQGELFDLLISMYGEDDPIPHILNLIEFHELKSVADITQFIQFDSNLYPNLDEIFIDFLIKKVLQ